MDIQNLERLLFNYDFFIEIHIADYDMIYFIHIILIIIRCKLFMCQSYWFNVLCTNNQF